MKINLVRHSGRPIKNEDNDEYNEEWKIRYDAIYKEYENSVADHKEGKISETDLDKAMNQVQTSVDEMQNILCNKYETIVQVEFPESSEAWHDLCTEYKAPCLVTHSAEREMLIVVMDNGI